MTLKDVKRVACALCSMTVAGGFFGYSLRIGHPALRVALATVMVTSALAPVGLTYCRFPHPSIRPRSDSLAADKHSKVTYKET